MTEPVSLDWQRSSATCAIAHHGGRQFEITRISLVWRNFAIATRVLFELRIAPFGAFPTRYVCASPDLKEGMARAAGWAATLKPIAVVA